MKRKIVIIGAGISGITTAYILHYLDPACDLTIIDAGPEPTSFGESNKTNDHHGATLGNARDARHFTGTEGLSFQNSVHTELLFKKSNENSDGWQTISEDKLTTREKHWRQECIDRYKSHVTSEHNPYDYMYTQLNYGGMASWEWLSLLQPELANFRISKKHIYVAFSNKEELLKDLESETTFNPFQAQDLVSLVSINKIHKNPADVIALREIASKLLQLPGTAWRIQSLWKYFYSFLQKQPNIKFIWNSPVNSTSSLPNADVYVWAAGTSYTIPEIYTQYSRVEGIGGWWLTIPNPGFRAPFKFSAPQPSGYINFTPIGNELHISGGFGWVGEREYKEAEQLLQSTKNHFLKDVARFLNMPESALNNLNSGCCIRPTTPTGLPDTSDHIINGKRHIMISGAGKAGSTQAPLLALHVADVLGLRSKLEDKLLGDQINSKLISSSLDLLNHGLEPTKT